MSQEDQLTEIAKSAAETFVKVSYPDAFKPVAKEIGKLLETGGKLLNLTISPIRLFAVVGSDYYEKVEASLRARIGNIPTDRLTGPSPNIAYTVLSRAPLVQEYEDLHEMFMNLLASDMDKDRKPYIHPSFAEIINQLSPADARLLKAWAFEKFQGKHAQLMMASSFNHDNYDENIKSLNNYFNHATQEAGINNQDDASISYANLSRLGLIRFECNGIETNPFDITFQNQCFYTNPSVKKDPPKAYNYFEFYVTPLGACFCNVCIWHDESESQKG